MKKPLQLPALVAMTAVLGASVMGQDLADKAATLNRLEKEFEETMTEFYSWQRKHGTLSLEIDQKTKRLEELRLNMKRLYNPAALESDVLEPKPGPTGTGVIPKSFIEKTSPYIVVIEGDKGSGTGFLAELGGKVWVYTAAHVLSGNSKLVVRDSRGRKYSEFEHMECAEGVDLVRLLPTKQDLKGLQITTPAEAPKVGDTVVAVGNSLGAGSLSLEAGVVNSVDETMWEVSNDIIPGNSGGPVLDLKSGKVTGIVTHLIMKRERRTTGMVPKLEIKRFAARLDREWKWERMPVARFVKEWQYIEKMEDDSMVGWATTYAIIYKLENPGIVITRDRLDDRQAFRFALEVIKEHPEHFSSQRTMEWLKKYEGDYHSKDSINKAKTVIANNINVIRLKGNEPKTSHFSWFHQAAYEEALGWRKEIFDRGKKESQ